MTDQRTARAPAGTRAAGRRLWESVVEEWELAEHELVLLREATRTVDTLDDLAAIVAAEGPMVESRSGPRVHPALTESRQLKIALARLLAAIRMPAGAEGDQVEGRRPQRRLGVRGVHSLGGGPP